MAITYNKKPSKTEAEVTVIGTGGGYGESIIIHLGENEWVIVDSCIDPITKENLPLHYLKAIGVDVAKEVVLIIASHWHDDHIKGISDIIIECVKSKFCFALQTDIHKFLLFIKLDSAKDKFSSSSKEFEKALNVLKERNNLKPIAASQDRLVFSGINKKIYTLSPSDYIIENFFNEISTILEDYTSSFDIKYVIDSPNDKSIVIFFSLKNHTILLGSDLEVSKNPNKGWLCILDNSTVIKTEPKPNFFKIPHHGSQTGYEPRIWEEILNKNPVATMTPWNRNQKLPKNEMIELYKTHSDKLYITSILENNQPKIRERSLQKTIKNFNDTLIEIKFHLGIIQNRIELDMEDCDWKTTTFGTATKL